MTTLQTLCIVGKPDYLQGNVHLCYDSGKKSISQIPATALFLALAKTKI